MSRPATTESADFADLLQRASMLVCAGAGGVGKTTTSAAIALAAAQQGRRVVVVTIDPARRLADAIGANVSSEPIRLPGVERGELWAVMLDTRATFDRLVRAEAKDGTQAEQILANRFYRNLTGALSGTQEYMASETLFQLHHDARFDLVVVDTPPTRNALDFMSAPERLVHFLDHRLYRMLIAPTRLGMKVAGAAVQPFLKTMSKVVGGDAIAEAIEFFQAFDGMETGFRHRAETVMQLLRSTQTGYVLVTSPRREAVSEATYFAEHLRERHLSVAAVVANRLHPTFGTGEHDDSSSDSTDPNATAEKAAFLENLRLLRHLAESEREALQPLLRATAAATCLRTVPLLDHDVHDLAGLATVADHLLGVHPAEPLR